MNTRERIIKIAYALNELNKTNGYLDLYRANRRSIDITGKKQNFLICFSISFERKDGNYIILSILNSKIRIIEISIGGAYVPGDVKTLLEVIQEKDIKTMIIDNLDLW